MHRRGHTDSDLSVEVPDASVIFCGDLIWNRMFPNYVDAVPSDLSRHVRALLSEPAERWIPGHGALGDRAAVMAGVLAARGVDAANRMGERAVAGADPHLDRLEAALVEEALELGRDALGGGPAA